MLLFNLQIMYLVQLVLEIHHLTWSGIWYGSHSHSMHW